MRKGFPVKLKTGDWTVMAIALILSGLLFWYTAWNREKGENALIYQNQELVYRLSLEHEQTVKVEGPLGHTMIRIQQGKVSIVHSPCPWGTCMKMGEIYRPGSLLVCVPNRILVRIEGSGEQDLDGITR